MKTLKGDWSLYEAESILDSCIETARRCSRSAWSTSSNLLSFITPRRLQPTPGQQAPQPQAEALVASAATRKAAPWTAADVMGADIKSVPPDQSVKCLWEASRADGSPAYLIGRPDHLVGVLRLDRLARAVESRRLSEPVGSLVNGRLIHGHADHPADIVLERLAQSGGVLPIVSREQTQRVLGVVTFAHVMRFIQARRKAGIPDA